MKHAFRHTLLVLVFVVAGCCAAQAQDEGKMQRLGSALSQLSPAAEAIVCCDPEAAALTDMQVFGKIELDDPRRLEPFKAYTLRLLRQGRHAAVLVCTQDGKLALLEDAGCTFKLDALRYKTPDSPCEFTLDLATICPKPQ